jgi:anti-sigma B factor antagonist
MITVRPVLAIQLPERLNMTTAREFWPEIEAVLKEDRARVVFDFTEVCQIDSAGVELLLKSLETVMRLDGDLKFAAIRPEVAVVLELTRVDRLFEMFASVDGAVESFQGVVMQEGSRGPAAWYPAAINVDAAPERAAS